MGIFDRLLGTRGEQPSEVTLDLVAAAPGDLDTVAGLGLPPGRPVVPEAGDVPIAWVSDAIGDYAALWARLAGEFPDTGLWPVLANGLGDGDLSRPWFDGELAGPDPAEPGDVLAFLGHASDAAAWVDEGEEDRDYRLRGLAAPTRSPGPVTITVPSAPTGLLLVPVTRPGAGRAAGARALRLLSRQRRPGRRQPRGLRPSGHEQRVVLLVGLISRPGTAAPRW